MSPRSTEYLAAAEARLALARAAVTIDPAGGVGAAYFACLNAARAALSERDLNARTHGGTWGLFRQTFVLPGEVDEGLFAAAAGLQSQRERADYAAATVPVSQAKAAIDVAGRFVAAIRTLLGV